MLDGYLRETGDGLEGNDGGSWEISPIEENF